MAKSSRTFVCSSISQPKHLHLLTPITAQFAARARRAVRWRPPEPRSLVSSCSGVGRGAEAGCGVEVTVSSEDTEHLLVTLDTDSQHQSLSGRPAAEAEAALWWYQSNSSLWESFWWNFLAERITLQNAKVVSPSQKPDPCVCHLGCAAVNWLPETRGSSAVPQQETEQLFYDKSAILLLVTATQPQSAVFSGNLLYQKYNFHASKNWRKVGAVRNASILCLWSEQM